MDHPDSAPPDRSRDRRRMVERHIAARGVRNEAVLRAMAEVPRERFVPPEQSVHAYADAPLPIGAGQTISQPFIVAHMADLAELRPGDRVLEVGTGSGYAAAVFSRAAGAVYTVERHASLAAEATQRFRELGYDNIHVAVRDGTLGWPEHAPYDAIIVAAGGPGRVPQALLDQLAPGGRLVIPRGRTQHDQELVRVRRTEDGLRYEEERLGAVRFVPLVGAAGWTPEGRVAQPEEPGRAPGLPERMAAAAEVFDDVASADLDGLLRRIGGARLVLIGEASHGTSEFYRMRARITQELIERHGFDFVAVEADWPDAAEVDAYVRHVPERRPHVKPFQRFPRWMWANTDVMEFVHWLRRHNDEHGDHPDRRVGFHGLDLYSMHTSIESVLRYLDDVDPDAAAVARDRYGCLTPWQNDPVLYGRAVLTGSFDRCEEAVLAMLNDLLRKRLDYTRSDGARFADAVQNARLVVNAEQYYRAMYRGAVASWNLRDQHMFDTLSMLLKLYGPDSRGVVWAHNSHLGDASATDMGARGEHNIGQLVRQAHGDDAYLMGFGTHTGTVAAASDWGQPVQIMDVRPSHALSYERLCHDTSVPHFMLPLRAGADDGVREALIEPRLERAIGVIYRPETELQSHYFHASLPRQFDEWIWFDTSSAVTEIGDAQRDVLAGMPDTFPFGL
ncbi:MAG TPA: protein-L-isoaspartate(D-aspartate) O-methyltransferase [Longimicrobiales bacterium]|nr:protein-L-isoaspartate(D-aspartate) O-methyltransferase [Longimicrobiales bacterium]